ncbi:MAG: hypothetical protein V3T86_05400, partial [Planctomycetota bacterium]
VTFRNYGQDVTLTVPLKQGRIKELRKESRYIADYQEKIAALAGKDENKNLFELFKLYDGLAANYQPVAGREAYDKWKKAVTTAFDYYRRALAAMASPNWEGYRVSSLHLEGKYPYSLRKTGEGARIAKQIKDRQTAIFVSILRDETIYAMKVRDVTFASALIGQGEALISTIQNKRWKETAIHNHHFSYSKLAHVIFTVTGSYRKAAAMYKRRFPYKVQLDQMRGKPREPSEVPREFKPDPEFDPG